MALGLPKPDVVSVHLGALEQFFFFFFFLFFLFFLFLQCFLNPRELLSICNILRQGVARMSCMVRKKLPPTLPEHTTSYLHLAESNSQASTACVRLATA